MVLVGRISRTRRRRVYNPFVTIKIPTGCKLITIKSTCRKEA
jgi:hypothetical protein